MIMRKKAISLCMITLNEEGFLNTSLNNVKDYVDEIIIVDGGSTDKTVEIANNFGAKIYTHKWDNDFAKQRNFSLKYATREWILLIDADEVYEKSVLKNLQLFANNEIGIDIFAYPRKNYIDGKLTDAYPDKQFRFFKNNVGIKYVNKVHEIPTGFTMVGYPTNMHIIHKKTSQRQKLQNQKYDEILSKQK